MVIDGITIGHPCCGVHNCHKPLQNHRHRFCPLHKDHALLCCITTCSSPAVKGSKVCDNPEHIAIQKVHLDRGQARFQLQRLLNEARAIIPDSEATADTIDVGEEEFVLDAEGQVVIESATEGTEYQLDANGQIVQEVPTERAACPDKPATGNRRLRAQFGRKRTHNEQIIVAPCGMIIARATFYGAEAVATVAVRVFCTLGLSVHFSCPAALCYASL